MQRAELNALKKSAKLVKPPLPEIHIVGEILGATGFGSSPVCCKWELEMGDNWEWIEGSRRGELYSWRTMLNQLVPD